MLLFTYIIVINFSAYPVTRGTYLNDDDDDGDDDEDEDDGYDNGLFMAPKMFSDFAGTLHTTIIVKSNLNIPLFGILF